jgi:hypothetical protein
MLLMRGCHFLLLCVCRYDLDHRSLGFSKVKELVQ